MTFPEFWKSIVFIFRVAGIFCEQECAESQQASG
jgi:hypothetical protein